MKRFLICCLIIVILFPSIMSLGKTRILAEKQLIKTVVIDAGHGGKDPGCHGSSANEKSVCLAIALELGKQIKAKYPSIKVIYTRDKDVFVELDERARIANKANADLFICIHANAASPAAYGAETYVLGLHRADAQAKVAERENAVISLEDDKGEKYKNLDEDAKIALELALQVYLDNSISFATKLQEQFKTLGRHDRGVRQAGFLVLYKTTMPSVLIETGFLTNIEEEKFLADTGNQTEMASAMYKAFVRYKDELEGNKTSEEETEEKNTTTNENLNSEENKNQTLLVEDKDAIIFKVQIETSEKKIVLNATRFKGLNVSEYKQDNLYKYTSGNFSNDFKSANEHKTECRDKGFSNAFVVAFQNGARINTEKAIKLAQK